MFPAVYLHYVAGRQSEWPDQAPVNAGPLHTRFAASRDGIAWEQYEPPAVRGAGHERRVRRKGARAFYGLVRPSTAARSTCTTWAATTCNGWDATTRTTKCSPRRGSNPRARRAPSADSSSAWTGFVSPRFDYTGGEFPPSPSRSRATAWCCSRHSATALPWRAARRLRQAHRGLLGRGLRPDPHLQRDRRVVSWRRATASSANSRAGRCGCASSCATATCTPRQVKKSDQQ